jgi:sugar phosphate isomerase/epimerase
MYRNLNAAALGVSGHQSEIIELVLTYGFQGMDVDIAEFANRAKLHGASYARRLISSARLRSGTFPLPVELSSDDATFAKGLQKLPEYAQVAAEMGCTLCVTSIAPGDDARPYHENFEFHRKRLAQVCAALGQQVRLGVGFHAAEYLRKGRSFQFIHDLDALTLLVNMVGAPNIGLLLDVWDLHLAGVKPEAIRNMKPEQVVAVNVANMPAGVAPADLDDTHRLLPNAEGGVVDVPGMLSALAAIKYDGPVTPMPSRSIFQNARRDVIVKDAGESLMAVWKAAGLDALCEAGIPLVQTYHQATTGKLLPNHWMIPEALRDDTGVIFASAFPGMDCMADEFNRYYTYQW